MSDHTDALSKDLYELFCRSESLSEDGLRELFERYGCTPKNNNLNIDDHDFVDMGFFLMVCKNERLTEGILRCLIEYFPRAGATSVSGFTPLHWMLCFNKNATHGMVQLLIDAYPESIRRANNNGGTPLHFLCINKDIADSTAVDILGLLLEGYPEATRRADDDGCLPIHVAAGQGSKSPEFCRMLIEAYPGSERISATRHGLPLHIACGFGRVATVEYLYKLYPGSINIADNDGCYPIHCAISLIRKIPAIAFEMVQMLLDWDPSLASQKYGNKFPLAVVCMTGDVASSVAVKVLHLLYDTYPEAIEDNIITQFSSMFPEEMQPFINSHLSYFRAARDRTFMSTRDEYGQFPLHRALRDNATLGSIKLLVQGDRDAVLYPDYDDDALPLHVACYHHESSKVVDYLIGLDPNTLTAVDWDGNTALHYACRSAKHNTIALLLEKYNAVSVSKTNGHNKLPIHLLLESNAAANRADDTKYTESIFHLLRAYPDTVMM